MKTKILPGDNTPYTMIDLDGYAYDNRQEFVNAPADSLPCDRIWLFLWRGERTPQNDEERKLAKSFAEMHAKGITNVEFPFD